MESTSHSKPQHGTSSTTENSQTTHSRTGTVPPPIARISTPSMTTTILTSHTHTIDLSTTPRRTRITRACDTCRRKKIRCDVNTTQPCTTCRQYHWECSFNDTAKKRGPPKGYIESLETRLKKMEQLLQQMQDKKRKRPDPSSALCIKNILTENDDENCCQEQVEMEQNQQKQPRTTAPTNVMTTAAPSPSGLVETFTNDTPELLIDLLVQKYFDVCTYSMPIIDKSDFFAAYNKFKNNNNNNDDNNNNSISQSLIYAMCAYAAYQLPTHDSIFNNFKYNNTSRDTAFHYFMDKAVDIVKNEYFVSKLATVQALVLICAQPVISTGQTRNWVFSGLAVRMAQEFRLHQLATNPPRFQQEVKGKHVCDLYKRLWCAVYNTDRWNAAAMGRPLAIADSDCDIELPDIESNPDLILFALLTQLSTILGEILRSIYSPQAKHYFHQSSFTAETTAESLVHRLQAELDRWFDHAFNKKSTNIPEEKTRPLIVCYYGVTLMLYRPFIDTRYNQIRASEKCSEIARKMTQLVKRISKIELARFGFAYTGYSIYQALLIHVYDMASNDSEISRNGREYLDTTMNECMIPLCEELSNCSDIKLIVTSTMDFLKAQSVKSPISTSEHEQGQQVAEEKKEREEFNGKKLICILRSAGPPLYDGFGREMRLPVWNVPTSVLLQK
ncbi:fungal-specific transcription factor domain-containing protein [Circinella umbellata]|nr:fungal-specific transcription factor domain-containing protein [Circinella umbellata]